MVDIFTSVEILIKRLSYAMLGLLTLRNCEILNVVLRCKICGNLYSDRNYYNQ